MVVAADVAADVAAVEELAAGEAVSLAAQPSIRAELACPGVTLAGKQAAEAAGVEAAGVEAAGSRAEAAAGIAVAAGFALAVAAAGSAADSAVETAAIRDPAMQSGPREPHEPRDHHACFGRPERLESATRLEIDLGEVHWTTLAHLHSTKMVVDPWLSSV